MLSFSNAKKGGDISEILSSSFEINLFNPACGYTVSSTHIISKKRGRKSGTNVEQTKKLAEKPVLAKVCFSNWELIVALIFLIIFWWAGDRFNGGHASEDLLTRRITT